MISAEQLNELLHSVIELSESVGAYMSAQTVSAAQVETKSLNNLVSHVDREAERRFVEGLGKLLPDAGIIAEEGTISGEGEEMKWIIDPLDGTTNYLHGLPFWCTSVALVVGDKVVLGVIYCPPTSESFSAALGMGAFLNGKRIAVSNCDELGASLLATGFPYDDFGRAEEYLQLLQVLMKQTRGIRRLGSAAMDLAYVACGRFEAFYEYGLNPWDVAAGIIIVEEAGGKISDFKGGNQALFGEEILASNGATHAALLGIINEHF